MHEAARNFINKQAGKHGPFTSVLEIGARNVNGSVKEFFTGSYTGIDKVEGNGVDEAVDALDWKPERSFDGIVCCEVLEHEPRWREIIARISEWLSPDGVAFITTASEGRAPHSAIDGGPLRPDEPYQNIDAYELARVANVNGLSIEELDLSNPGDLYAVLRK